MTSAANRSTDMQARKALTTLDTVVIAQGLCRHIDNRAILHDLNFQITSGCYLALLGANGAGKSTLLSMLATLTVPTSGQLMLFGKDVGRSNPAIRSHIGMIGHQAMLYRDLTALENLVFFGKLYNVKQPHDRAEMLLDQVALLHRADDPARTFSRGMVQRLAIARALMHDPQLLLADEPFSGLDMASSAMLENLLADLHANGKTIILVNHDITQSLHLAQRAIALRQGRIVLDEPTSVLDLQTVIEEIGIS
jgi:ABC-type multidrug transport system ATPase subunit